MTASRPEAAIRKHLLNRVGLHQGARVAVEDEPLGAIGLIDTLGDDGVDDGVGNQLAGIHHRLGALADFGAGLDGGTQHVARRKLGYAVFFYQSLCLRPLARPWRPKQYQPHLAFFPPRSFDFLIRPSYWCAIR